MSVLETVALTRRFGGLVAVEGLDLAVAPGEVRALIGPNGSGKSTVINLVTGVLRPSAGRVRFRDEDVTGRAPDALFRLGMARTFQTPRVVAELSVLDNVVVALARLGPLEIVHALTAGSRWRRRDDEWRAAARELLDRVGLGARAESVAGTLPPGGKRLLEIARALAGDPALLLLDEPVAGLSRTDAARAMDVVRTAAARGIAVVLVEHNMRVVMAVADRVTVLDFGHVIADGTPAQVRQDPAVLEAYLGGGARGRRGVRDA